MSNSPRGQVKIPDQLNYIGNNSTYHEWTEGVTITPVKRTDSSVKEQRRQALNTAKQKAKNDLKRILAKDGHDFESARNNKKLWKKVKAEFQKRKKQYFQEIVQNRQNNRSNVSNQISTVNPKWNSLRHKTQKVSSKNLNWNNRNQKITKNFTIGELIGNSKPPITAQQKENLIKVARLAQRIRDKWGSGIAINSGYRDPEHNKKVGGVKNSQHKFGKALDIRPTNGKIKEFHDWLYKNRKKFGIGGFGHGQHRGFVHIDIGRSREWNY